MANPKKPAQKKATTTGISLPVSLQKAAKQYAFKQGRSLSNLIQQLLTKELEEQLEAVK